MFRNGIIGILLLSSCTGLLCSSYFSAILSAPRIPFDCQLRAFDICKCSHSIDRI